MLGSLSKFIVIILTYSAFSIALNSEDVTFHLFNAGKPEEGIPLTQDSFDQKLLPFNESRRIILIIHGWVQSSNESYVKEIKNLILRPPKKRIMVITVDWSKFAKNDYDAAKGYNYVVANAVMNFLSFLKTSQKLKFENIEIICHCMGCHIAGIACKNISQSFEEKIEMITALDPAGPGYFASKEDERLSSDDANIVFVVHTDAFMFGYGERCGTIDFYPNGGKSPQPGCSNVSGVIEHDLCSHKRSIELFIESLDHLVFYGVKCPSYVDYRKGFCSSNSKVNFAKTLKKKYSGTYFYSTNTEKPYLRRK